jgi:hypothetical protein
LFISVFKNKDVGYIRFATSKNNKMKKLIFSISLILFLGYQCFAQIGIEMGYFGFSLGTAMPVGVFSSNDANNSAAGLATLGFKGDISLAYGTNGFHLFGMLRTQNNPLNVHPIEAVLASHYPGTSWSVSEASWYSSSLTVGAMYSIRINSNLNLLLKAMYGLAYTTSPELTFNGRQGMYSANIVQESASSYSGCRIFGAGLKIRLTEDWGLLLNGDYSSTMPDFKNVKTSSHFAPPVTTSFSQSYTTVNFSLGVAFTIRTTSNGLRPGPVPPPMVR